MTRQRIRLGEWVIPENHVVIVSIAMAHSSEANFPNAEVVQPGPLPRGNPDTHTWIPFGGGVRRCIGAAFANMEMNVTLRTLLREFEFGTTYAAGERIHSRGVATAPARGGRAVVYRRKAGFEIDDPQRSERGVSVTPERWSSTSVAESSCATTLIGDPDDPPIVLIAGLGQQLHGRGRPDFAKTLAGRGYRVTRFDNRDVGRSTHMDFPAPKPWQFLRGGNHPRQYHLGDMARDTVGLLDALGYQHAHLVGISMGGMIAQTVAAHYPGRVRTLTSIMSTTGATAHRPACAFDMVAVGDRASRRAPASEAIERDVAIFRHIGSHGFPFDEDRVAREGRRRLGSRSDDRRHAAAAGRHLPLRRPHRRSCGRSTCRRW